MSGRAAVPESFVFHMLARIVGHGGGFYRKAWTTSIKAAAKASAAVAVRQAVCAEESTVLQCEPLRRIAEDQPRKGSLESSPGAASTLTTAVSITRKTRSPSPSGRTDRNRQQRCEPHL